MKKSTSVIFKTKRRITAFVISLVVIILAAVCLITNNYTPKADTTSLNKLLVEASDLTTAKLNITNMTEYTDTGTKIFNRSDFIMVYDATVWAGIDVKKIDIKADDVKKVINVKIPKAEIQNVKVDPSTIKYFDEKFSFFNTDAKEDANRAVELAEEETKKDAVKTGILELADKQSATLIEGLLAKAVPKGYQLDIRAAKD